MRRAALVALAAFTTLLGVGAGHAEKRVALVIGNGAYKNALQLPNPKNDAEDVSAALKREGFDTIVGFDLDKTGMDDATIRFARSARDADVAIFYYSGHALQFAGINYLMPVDAKLSDEADLRRMTRVDDIVADLQQARNLRILVLDSCRDNPLADDLRRSIGLTRAASMQRGLARTDAPQGMIVAYATQSGQTAEDGSGRNSPYTAAFLRHIEAPEEIGTMFRKVSADVYNATSHKQLPELSLSFIGEFYLKTAPQRAPTAAVPSNPPLTAAPPLPEPPPATHQQAAGGPFVPAKVSYWKHNDSVMYLTADGPGRRFFYFRPRPGLVQSGAQVGSLLFAGEKSGEQYSGTAYIFAGACGTFPYQVSGLVSNDDQKVTMRGQAPRVDRSNCSVTGYRSDVLVFEYMHSD